VVWRRHREAHHAEARGPQCAAQDGKVAGAAAQISYQRRSYIVFARLRALPQQRGQRDREARRAIAALKGDLGNESGADRASFGPCIKRFWRNDVGAVERPIGSRISGGTSSSWSFSAPCAFGKGLIKFQTIVC
jgi:hypothetical protein